jgi:DNA gyrase subunit A
VIVDVAATTARGQVLLVTSQGRAFKTDVLTLPVLPEAPGTVSLRGGVHVNELVSLRPGERVVTVSPLACEGSPGLALGTRAGQVKVTKPEWPVRADEFDVIGLGDGDEVVGAAWLQSSEDTLVFVSSDGQVLRFDAGKVRPQGCSGGGMAGINLADGAHVVSFNAVRAKDSGLGEPMVVVSTGTQVKVTPLSEYPAKGRATGGVATLRVLAGMNPAIEVAWVGARPAGCTTSGAASELPEPDTRRAGSGVVTSGPDLIGHHVERN